MTQPDDDIPLDRILTLAESARREVRRLTTRDVVLGPDEATALPRVRLLVERLERLIAEANDEVERARTRGFAEGRQQGYAEAVQALAAARAEYDALLTRAEADMVSLALELARRIVGRHIEVDPDGMANLVRQTLTLAQPRRRLELRVHPERVDRLEGALPPSLVDRPGLDVTLIADSSVPPDGCRIETESGVIETDLDTQIRLLSTSLGVGLWSERGARQTP